ncbi:NodS family protein [Brevundimonas sp. LM2]|uniref:SAM-dependent methyltransferase n=1 Tax=Brevundimonas sp. LM2 TaxID=1938605 RepID=UPI000983970A|nr:SAM-dependent methyltransferase [Brevundimonas sp. LM2]AQR62863.1 NodS family protein [Brevundimonas sp. LM2]
MTRPDQSLKADYFEDMFQGDDDPWGLESRPYEAAKFDRSVQALEGRHYPRGFEVGCAGGTLTQRLAPLTGDLLAVDISETALARARRRCADQPQVRFARMAFPGQTPTEPGFDLIVLSEVAYYWDDADLDRAAAFVAQALVPGGDLLLVHFTGETDYPQTGDAAVQKLAVALATDIEVVRTERHSRYRLDLWRRR